MLYYTVKGSGIPVLLIHGFCENASVWEPVIDDLPEGFTYIIPELPGFGNTPAIDPITIKDYADFILDILLENAVEKCIVIGHSMGGYIALEIAENEPDKIAGLGLFHSHPYADNEARITARKRAVEFIETQGAIPYIKEFVPALFSPQHREAQIPYIPAQLENVIGTSAAGLTAALHAMMLRSDKSETLRRATYPVLIMAGKHDAVVTPEMAFKAAQLAAFTQLEWLPESAHMGMMEETGSCVKGITGFLSLCAENFSP